MNIGRMATLKCECDLDALARGEWWYWRLQQSAG
jgi:hypothetical protein